MRGLEDSDARGLTETAGKHSRTNRRKPGSNGDWRTVGPREHQGHNRLRPYIQVPERDAMGQNRCDIIGEQAESNSVSDQVQVAENVPGALRNR